MAQLFETLMLICFGCSWPISVVKSYRSRTAKGKSVIFTYAIIVGYICGIAGKIAGETINYVLILYVLNLVMVTADLVLYYRNRRLDSVGEATVVSSSSAVFSQMETKAETERGE